MHFRMNVKFLRLLVKDTFNTYTMIVWIERESLGKKIKILVVYSSFTITLFFHDLKVEKLNGKNEWIIFH